MFTFRSTIVTFWLLLSALPHLLSAQATVTLTTTPNPSRLGAAVTLTAAVSPSTSTGAVTFYDGVTVLGTKTLASGAASLSTISLPAGTRKLRAYYSGTTSNVVTQVVNAQASASFAARSVALGTGTQPQVLATGDFNNDSKADLIIYDILKGNLSILLGDGAGDFPSVPNTIHLVYAPAYAIGVGDFNGDGNLDIAFPGGATVLVLLGKGDGSFQTPAVYALADSTSALAVADFNGDGKPDIVTANPASVDILLGRGDGTFQTPVPYLSNIQTGSNSFLVVADFNNDGKPDVAVVTGNTYIAILPGNGDGTLQSPVLVSVPHTTYALLAADLNNDGKPDLVTEWNTLLGKGDGTFQKPVTYDLVPGNIAASDFNGDGNIDLFLTGPRMMLLGKGDGTFQPPVEYTFGAIAPTYSFLVGEFNGDGKTDIAVGDLSRIGLLLGTTVTVIPTTGTPQSTPKTTTFPVPLQLVVKDGTNPVSGVIVNYVVDPAYATLSSTTAVTDANGLASVTATAKSQTGSYTVTATALGVTTPFSLTNLSGPPSALIPSPAGPQSTSLGTAFPLPLQVTLKDTAGTPASGVPVTFTAPLSGASATLSSTTVLTDATGTAKVTATANSTRGSYTVTATVAGLSANFRLTNLQAASITLSTSANPTTLGAPLTLVAVVGGAVSTGRVTFYDGVSLIGTKPLSSGVAAISTITLAAGVHKLTAVYRDDANFVGGASNAVTETVKTNASAALLLQPPLNLPGVPSTAVVGDFNGDGKADFAYAALLSVPSWWQVDLGASTPIGSVIVWNRTDCCGERLGDYWVFVSDTPFGPDDTPDILKNRAGTFSSHQTTAPSPSTTVSAGGAQGRYVRVQLSGFQILSLAEVQVFGIGAQPGINNLALGKAATQSSTYPGYAGTGASSAVDGNTDGNFFHASVSTTTLYQASILLGKGDGTFQAPINYGIDAPGGAIASGDFNGDGNTDLALFGLTGQLPVTGNVNILLGNGDGTFRAPVDYSNNLFSGTLNAPTIGIAVGDFNGDGKADILMGASYFSSTISSGSVMKLMPGNGDGTFGAPGSYAPVPSPFLLADFNGDSKPDVAGIGPAIPGLAQWVVSLGNGDGTGTITTAGLNPGSGLLVEGDFNGDGKTDIAAPNSIFLGNGDGTFQAPLTLPAGAAAAASDFNGDGVLDLVTGTGVLLGNGDGTFRQGFGFPAATTLAVADFNGDGRADLLTSSGILLGATSTSISLTPVAGTAQFASVNTPFATALQVKVVQDGNPVAGVTVTFSAPTVGASATLSSATATTNAQGIATVTATANGIAGSYTVNATYNGQSAGFSLTNTVYAFLTATGGTPQSTVAGTAFANPLQATLKDALGNPVAGVTVTFSAPTVGASATLSSATAVTNASGVASVTATANGISGSYSVTASVTGLSTQFSLINMPVQVSTVTPIDGTPQSATVNTAFAKALQVVVKGPGSNDGIAGVTVTFLSPSVGATATLSSTTVVTNAQGIASVTAIANAVAGSYTVTAGVGSITGHFALTNTAGAAGTLTSSGGTPQSAQTSAAFANPLQATLKDSLGNPVAGATVTFTAPTVGAGATLSSATAVTDASGVASVTATANNIAGNYVVTASAGPLSTLFSLTNVSSAPGNLALRKSATQSSTLPGYPGAAASSAVDGNTNGSFYGNSVTATNQEAHPWWQVDLGATSTVNSVVIFNRTDCCADRLTDFWVFVSANPFQDTDTPATLQNRASTFAAHVDTADPAATIQVGGLLGRYVRVQLTGTTFLSLAEVQVIGTGGIPPTTNLAASKLASQSSTLAGYPTDGPSSAVDGNTDGAFFNGSVTATNQEISPWWQVDLGASASVNSISIFNRTDCCGTRLNDYWIFISDIPFNANDTPATLQNRAGTFAFHQTTAPSPSATIPTIIHPCPPAALCPDYLAQGRYVRIQLTGTDFLSLAEVQVFGTGGAPAPTLVSQGKPASQSSTLPGYPSAAASSAVDGNTDGGFFNNSVTATNPDTNAWWQVDLGASTSVNSVVVWNRTDCCATRLNDYWVFVSDTPFNANDTPATLQNRAGTFASHQTTAPAPSTTIPVGAPGRYLRVQLTGTNYLSLAEVQVYGQ